MPGRTPIPRRIRIAVLAALLLLDFIFVWRGTGTALALFITLGLMTYGLLLLARTVMRKSGVIWRLRNRLIVTYGFVGAVPIVLILALAYCGAWIVVGQVSTYLVTSELGRRAASLENPARFIAQASPGQRAELIRQLSPVLTERVPGFEVLVSGDQTLHYPSGSTLEPPPDALPAYTGVALKNGRFYCMSLVRTASSAALILAPLTPEVLQQLVPGIGALGISREIGTTLRAGLVGTVPPAYGFLDSEFPWPNPIEIADWDSAGRDRAYVSVISRPSAVLGVVFSASDLAQPWLLGFALIAGLLAVVEFISVVVSFRMTRTITGAVHNLYEGTLRIGKGDFSHRIPVKGRDQLADLGNSFNQMTAQLENLVVVAKEKERLQSELTIASDVQNQLFPRAAPATRTIRLIGACEPARSVSGDYYDYLCLPDGNLALAIGDVAGKGISAALLMASIQSIMRTQLAAGVPVSLAAGGGHSYTRFSTASVVEQLNRQLYANTSPEKYATFFFGLYDEGSRVLTYTNAGHLSPLLISGNDVVPLEVTGTVVGLFPSVRYEERSVHLSPLDLLVAYTDGITEPENAYGEEFGVDRLTEAVMKNRHCEPVEIVARAMEAVKLWSAAPELPDDMTVVIAQGVA